MNEIVMVPIPLSREAADALGDAEKLQSVGRLVSDLLRPTSPGRDPLVALIVELKAEVRREKLTDEEIDAELEAYNAERRSRPA